MNTVFIKVGVEFGCMREVLGAIRQWAGSGGREGLVLLKHAIDFLHMPLVVTQATECQQFVAREGGTEVFLASLDQLQQI